jgi:hypothetical protein
MERMLVVSRSVPDRSELAAETGRLLDDGHGAARLQQPERG